MTTPTEPAAATLHDPHGDEPGAGVGARLAQGWRDVVASRRLGWVFFTRDFAAKYRESYLGYAWVFLPSVVLTLTMVMAGKGAVLNVPESAVPFPVVVLVGVVLWQTFSEAVLGPIQGFAQQKPLLAKIKFPYEAMLWAKGWEVLMTSTLRLAVLVPVFAYYGVVPASTAPLALAGGLALILIGAVIGMALAPIAGLYSDITQGLTLVLGLAMFLTPVVYEKAAPGSLLARLNAANPVTPVLTTTRGWVLGLDTDPVGFALVTGAAAAAAVVVWQFWRFAITFAVERAG